MEPVIRQATFADVPALLALWRSADAVPSITDTPEALRVLFDRDPESVFVAEIDGRIVGSVIAAWDGYRGGIYRLAVEPSQQRQGLGRALVGVAEDRLSRAGAQRIAAVVIRSHEHAVSFWDAVGYQRDDRVHRYIKTIER